MNGNISAIEFDFVEEVMSMSVVSLGAENDNTPSPSTVSDSTKCLWCQSVIDGPLSVLVSGHQSLNIAKL